MTSMNRICSIFISPSIHRFQYLKKSIHHQQIFNTIYTHIRLCSSNKSSLKRHDSYVKKPIPEDWDQIAQRFSEEADLYMYYDKKKIFSPDSNIISRSLICWGLQAPSKTRVPPIDFLIGAKFSTQLAYELLFSKDFIQYARDGILSPIINTAKEIFDTKLYYHLRCLRQFQEKSAPGSIMEFQNIELNDMYITSVKYHNLYLGEYKSQEYNQWIKLRENYTFLLEKSNIPMTTEHIHEDKELMNEEEKKYTITETDYEDIYEYMDIKVQGLLRAKRTIQNDKNEDVKSEWIIENIKLTFRSNVTSPDEIDWQIYDISVIGNNIQYFRQLFLNK